eukprot:g1217.t1
MPALLARPNANVKANAISLKAAADAVRKGKGLVLEKPLPPPKWESYPSYYYPARLLEDDEQSQSSLCPRHMCFSEQKSWRGPSDHDQSQPRPSQAKAWLGPFRQELELPLPADPPPAKLHCRFAMASRRPAHQIIWELLEDPTVGDPAHTPPWIQRLLAENRELTMRLEMKSEEQEKGKASKELELEQTKKIEELEQTKKILTMKLDRSEREKKEITEKLETANKEKKEIKEKLEKKIKTFRKQGCDAEIALHKFKRRIWKDVGKWHCGYAREGEETTIEEKWATPRNSQNRDEKFEDSDSSLPSIPAFKFDSSELDQAFPTLKFDSDSSEEEVPELVKEGKREGR